MGTTIFQLCHHQETQRLGKGPACHLPWSCWVAVANCHTPDIRTLTVCSSRQPHQPTYLSASIFDCHQALSLPSCSTRKRPLQTTESKSPAMNRDTYRHQRLQRPIQPDHEHLPTDLVLSCPRLIQNCKVGHQLWIPT